MNVKKTIYRALKIWPIGKEFLINAWPNPWQVLYVIENANWSTDQDGYRITEALNEMRLIRTKTSICPVGCRKKIVHLGCLPLYPKIKFIGRSNKIIQTIFHIGEKHWSQVEAVKKNIARTDWIHTACEDTFNKLRRAGIAEKKIKVIPLGVDLNIFKKATAEEKKAIREKLCLPQNKIIIGSFQRDGNGWGEGDGPKFIKGPDIFCAAIAALAKKYPLHVLLTGPARGYVRERLDKDRVPYTHQYLKSYYDIVPYWQALDLYLITSRIEGGPKALLEAWATGVPLVSTRVGMVADIAQDEQNVLLAEVEDIREIVRQAERIINNRLLAEQLIAGGLNGVVKYDWRKIAKRYYKELYAPLLR